MKQGKGQKGEIKGNLYVLLEQYNNQDVGPSREATKKLAEFFRDIKLDIHKDGLSISGLSLKYLWAVKDAGSEFKLFNGNEDLYPPLQE